MWAKKGGALVLVWVILWLLLVYSFSTSTISKTTAVDLSSSRFLPLTPTFENTIDYKPKKLRLATTPKKPPLEDLTINNIQRPISNGTKWFIFVRIQKTASKTILTAIQDHLAYGELRPPSRYAKDTFCYSYLPGQVPCRAVDPLFCSKKTLQRRILDSEVAENQTLKIFYYNHGSYPDFKTVLDDLKRTHQAVWGSVFRDPVERLYSEFRHVLPVRDEELIHIDVKQYHCRWGGKYRINETLGDDVESFLNFVKDPENAVYLNRQTKMIAGDVSSDFQLQVAMERISKFDFIGIVSQMNQTMVLLDDFLTRYGISMKQPENRYDPGDKKGTINLELIRKKIERLEFMDVILFKKAQEIFQQRLEEWKKRTGH